MYCPVRTSLVSGQLRKQRKYALYIFVTEHDLHQALIDQDADGAPASELEVQMPAHVPAALEAAGDAPASEPVQLLLEPAKALLLPFCTRQRQSASLGTIQPSSPRP